MGDGEAWDEVGARVRRRGGGGGGVGWMESSASSPEGLRAAHPTAWVHRPRGTSNCCRPHRSHQC